MKKTIIFGLLAVAALFASCSDKNTYTISAAFSGRAETKDSTAVFLYGDPKGTNFLDSTIVKDGKFTLKGIQEKPIMAYVGMLVADRYPMMLPVVLEGGNISIKMNDNISVSGTPLNDRMKAENDSIDQRFARLDQIYNAGLPSINDEEDQQALELQVQEGHEKIMNGLVAFIKENIDNPLGSYFFINSAQMLTPDRQKEIIAIMPEEAKANEFVARLAAQIEAAELTEIGRKFIDVNGITPEGQQASLSDHAGKGKVVLVDFWASWCGPCIAEMPNVKKAYDAYKNKGFEIVGISLDGNKEAWAGAIKRYDMKWPQFSNLKGWDEPAAQAYGISSIPHTLLLDKDGIIIAKNLRGEEIANKLKELLK